MRGLIGCGYHPGFKAAQSFLSGAEGVLFHAWPQPVNDVSTHHKSGAEGNRTPDLLVANEARCQLRYSPSHRPDREGQASTRYAAAKNYSFEARSWRDRATASSASC